MTSSSNFDVYPCRISTQSVVNFMHREVLLFLKKLICIHRALKNGLDIRIYRGATQLLQGLFHYH